MTENPLVTCLCLTKKRREWLPKAIACFQAQTYPQRELLIIADGYDDVEGVVPVVPRITVAYTGPLNVGCKRNFGCALAHGELIAHWDDDDYSAPGRLTDQVERLRATEKAVTGYQSMKFTDGVTWWLYKGWTGFALATSLCYRRAWWEAHRFAELQCGQDEEFVAKATAAKQLAAVEDLGLMYATIHPGNTSPRGVKSSGASSCWVPLREPCVV